MCFDLYIFISHGLEQHFLKHDLHTGGILGARNTYKKAFCPKRSKANYANHL